MNGRFITEPTPDPETTCEACGTNNVVYRVSSLTTARSKTCASTPRATGLPPVSVRDLAMFPIDRHTPMRHAAMRPRSKQCMQWAV